MVDPLMTSPDYSLWLGEVQSRIQSARTVAARAVNRELILLYWDIGRGIVEKQEQLGWGKAIVDQLARDLKQSFPEQTGFSASNLWRMRQFYLLLSDPIFLAQVVREMELLPSSQSDSNDPFLSMRMKNWRQAVAKDDCGKLTRPVPEVLAQSVRELAVLVPWGQHVVMLPKMKSPAEHFYYLQATARFGWTRKVLLNQIKAGAYERSLAEGKSHNFPATLPEHLAEQAEETLKSAYNLEFLGINREIRERELEDKLTEQLKGFILELGYGFCFIGRQYRLALGNKEYFIDLLFYHRFLKSLVAIELKIGAFEPEFSGKMDFYLNLLNDKERAEGDNPSIGIILCAEKDDLEVEFALKSKANPIGVAEYQLNPTLPKELRGKLPSARELGEAIGLPTKKSR